MPGWLFAIILLRDLAVAFGAVLYHFIIGEFTNDPPFSSKLNTTFQIIYLTMLMASQGIFTIPLSWIDFSLYAVAATTTISGLEYVWIWSFKAWAIKNKG
jgi:cardiolipin synthase